MRRLSLPLSDGQVRRPLRLDQMAVGVRVEHPQRLAQRMMRFPKDPPLLLDRDQFARNFSETLADRSRARVLEGEVSHFSYYGRTRTLSRFFSFFRR